MDPEARDRATTGGARDAAGDGRRSEVERLRRENRRLEARLEGEKRRREHLIDRYEALLPDGSEAEDERGADGGRRTVRDAVAGAAGYAVRAAFARGRRWVRVVRARRR